MLLFILSLCGFSGALATRLLDPLITSIAAEFATTVGVVALLSSAFALPFGLSQPLLGPTGDAFGKAVVIKVATAVLAPLPAYISPCARPDSPLHQPHSRRCGGGWDHAGVYGAHRRPVPACRVAKSQ